MNTSKRSNCPIACSLDIFGDKWSLLIIRDIHYSNKHRFEEFLQSKEGISTNILTDRLKKLESIAIIIKTKYSSHENRMNYLLTEKGKKIIPIIESMIEWGLENIEGTEI
ncbi:MAG: helix-turn-helix transcriptional regulator [Leptospiraceae bacterium]|nr:helix-turn-helix transcriptional regulator [Leptospiraceae bacterium]